MRNMDEIIDVKGMHCKSCSELIENRLSMLKGIETIRVSYPDEKAYVKFNPKQIALKTIKKEIENVGYKTDLGGSSKKTKSKNNTILQGMFYGLVPHVGCIAFLIFSVLGVTVATAFIKPLMLNPYFFYILIAISIIFATVSSIIYLKNQGFLTVNRIQRKFEISLLNGTFRRKWKYLTTMYGTTIAINLILFMLIFPLVANIDSGVSLTGAFASAAESTDSEGLMTLQVNIPCPGHAPLISGELKTINGVENVKFRFPNYFDIGYNPSQASQQQILSLDVFDTYPASVVDKNIPDSAVQDNGVVGGCGAGCGSSCGTGGGGCGCGG